MFFIYLVELYFLLIVFQGGGGHHAAGGGDGVGDGKSKSFSGLCWSMGEYRQGYILCSENLQFYSSALALQAKIHVLDLHVQDFQVGSSYSEAELISSQGPAPD